MSELHWLSPGDPNQRTGGYLYNARMTNALRQHGFSVNTVVLESDWPAGGDSHAATLDAIPDGAVVVADGLLWPGLMVDERRALCERTSVWVVVHSLMDKEGSEQLAALETNALAEARGCFATSGRTASIVSERLGGTSVPVVVPGTEAVEPNQGSGANRLLAVGHVIPRKGYRRLLHGLANHLDSPWTLDIVGSLDRDADHATEVQAVVVSTGLAGRVRFLGELDHDGLERAYASADALVHAAHFEAFGMVLTEALQRGLPVVSTPAGALDGVRSGAVQVVDGSDVAAAIMQWVSNPERMARARSAARLMTFPGWSDQAEELASVLGFHRPEGGA